jgi:hypothetical protein
MKNQTVSSIVKNSCTHTPMLCRDDDTKRRTGRNAASPSADNPSINDGSGTGVNVSTRVFDVVTCSETAVNEGKSDEVRTYVPGVSGPAVTKVPLLKNPPVDVIIVRV